MKNAWESLGRDAAVIILLTVVTYLPALHGGFVFDDYPLIIDNRMVKASDGLYRFWLTTEAPDYYPLTCSLWWLEWRLWHLSPMGYHVVNVLLHAVNAVLVWLILRRLKIPGAWGAGLVFAVHPVNVATVAWVAEQKNTLSMLFYAVAILLYLRFYEEDRWSWYGLSLAAFLLALLSKSAVVMLPVVLLGCVWWTRGRVRWKDFLFSMPFFVLSLVWGLTAIWFQHNRALEGHAVRTVGFVSRLAAAGWVPWFYLYKVLLPFDLTVVYPKWQVDASHWVSYVPGMILVGCLALFWWKRSTWGRPLFFGLSYFVVTLFPVLGFFDQGFYNFSLVADHWQYYSIVGAIVLAVATWDLVCRRIGEHGQHWGRVAGVAVLMVLGAATWKRSCVYANDKTLWQDNVAKNPNAWLAHNNLGTALSQRGKTEEAIGQFQTALRLKPDDAEAHDNLGAALWQAGKVQEAIAEFEQALRIKPDDPKAHSSLGLALARLGKPGEAAEHWEQALRIKPDDVRTLNNLGIALAQEGKTEEAIRHFEQALQINPGYAEAHCSLGNALAQEGKTEEAIRHYEQALRIKPGYADARNGLARLRVVP